MTDDDLQEQERRKQSDRNEQPATGVAKIAQMVCLAADVLVRPNAGVQAPFGGRGALSARALQVPGFGTYVNATACKGSRGSVPYSIGALSR